MATVNPSELSEVFKTKFGISEVHDFKQGGQKKVFIVTRGEGKYALKIFEHYGKREIRELAIYEEFKEHDYIPKISSVENHDDDVIVFEHFIEGDSLDEIVARYKGESEKVKELVNSLCKTLQPFWERPKSIVHRDIKPSNIRIDPSGSPHILDFGIARDLGDKSITGTGFSQPGSWGFASPEQFLGKKELIDYRTDFFCIGILAYYLFYNRLPFGSTKDEVAENFKTEPIKFSTDDACPLNNLFASCFKLTVAARPRTVESLIDLLK